MKIFILFFTIVLLGFSDTSIAYNHRKCMHWKSKGHTGVMGLSLSSSSFFTSTGDCAMIGSISERKQQFIAFNYTPLQKDSARGQGEYLSTYANLSGCSKDATKKFADSLQRNMTQVFGAELDNSPEQAYNEIELLIFNDPALSANCNPKT